MTNMYKMERQLKYCKNVEFIKKELIPTLVSKRTYWREKFYSLPFWSLSKKCRIVDFLEICRLAINKYDSLIIGMGGLYLGGEGNATHDLKYIELLESKLKESL